MSYVTVLISYEWHETGTVKFSKDFVYQILFWEGNIHSDTCLSQVMWKHHNLLSIRQLLCNLNELCTVILKSTVKYLYHKQMFKISTQQDRNPTNWKLLAWQISTKVWADLFAYKGQLMNKLKTPFFMFLIGSSKKQACSATCS